MLPWVRFPYAIIQWAFWSAIKFPLAAIGLVAVALSLAGDGRNSTPRMWRIWAQIDYGSKEAEWSIWYKYYWYAIRNPVGGLSNILRHPTQYETYGDIDESQPGFQWRYRHTTWADSLRLVWGKPNPKKGKKEVYIGWKIGSTSPYKFTVQFRPF